MIKLGEKIRMLRKQKNISQEVLAEYLGVSFQAVSKWENGSTMPDVLMIPAIASFFGVSTDELFDFNLYEIEKNVEAIVIEHRKYWETDKERTEQIIRDGLKKYPGNEVLLNCLIGTLSLPEHSDEVISIAKALAESAKYGEVRLDAYRIMAEAYHSKGEYQSTKDAIECIPEIYFTKLEVAAELLQGDEKYEAARKQRNLSAMSLIDMFLIIGKYMKQNGEHEKANQQLKLAKKVVDAFIDDTGREVFPVSGYPYMLEKRTEIENLLIE